VRILATIMSTSACVVAVLATSGCDSTSSQSPDPTGSTSSQSPDPTGSAPTTQVEQDTPQWTMPGLVGATLQDAQDQIQTLTGGAVYFTDSHDLTGENRNQVLDANWKVCTQNVDPGAPVTAESRVDFGVVKLEEACP
jgi:hypothetical protein